MNKEFDSVELKNKIQEELWVEGGETLEGLKKILFNKEDNELYKFMIERKKKEDHIETA